MVAFIYLIVYIYLLCKSLFLHCITSYFGKGVVAFFPFFHPIFFIDSWYTIWGYWFCRCERFFCAFFSMFLQTIKFFGCSTAMYDSLLLYIILDDVISLQHSCTIQGIPCKLKVAIWVIYMSEKSMLGSWNRAFSIEFEKSIRKPKK